MSVPTHSIEQAWLAAGRAGNIRLMKHLRDQHPDILHLDRKAPSSKRSRTTGFCSWEGFHLDTIGASALHTAAWHGDDKVAEYLLKEGQDPDTEDTTGMTLIMIVITRHNLPATRCVLYNHVPVQRNHVTDCQQEDAERIKRTVDQIRTFIKLSADVNRQCKRGSTALHYATCDETYEVANTLLAYGAEIDEQDEDGKTPLYHCIEVSSLMVADLLIQYGAQLYLPDNKGVTQLQLVLRAHDTTMLQIILNHHQLVPTEKGEDFAGSVFMAAVDEEALPVISFCWKKAMSDWTTRMFTDNGARVLGLLTTSNESCLHYAARYSSSEELDCYGLREHG